MSKRPREESRTGGRMFSRVKLSARPNLSASLCLMILALLAADVSRGQNFNEYAIPTGSSSPAGIAAGIDGNLWFTESGVAKIGRITTSGTITEFPLPSSTSSPATITAGPDGNLWFADNKLPGIGRITPLGGITMFPISASGSGPADITSGPDGALWFTDNGAGKIGRITTSGAITFFNIPSGGGSPLGITKGPDGNLWFTEVLGGMVGRITPAGIVTEFPLPSSNGPSLITSGPDGALWFSETLASQIGRVGTSGTVTEFPTGISGGTPVGITKGPDNNLWFVDNGANIVGRMTTTGVVTKFTIPTGGSGPAVITVGPDGALWFTENSANKIGRMTVPSASSPTLTISKSAPASVASGTSLSYTITYGNSGSGAASGVIISDSLPTGTNFVSATGGGVLNAGAVTWNIGTLAAGATGQTVSFTVAVVATSGTITNSNYSIQATNAPLVFGSPIATSVTSGGGGGGGGLANLTPYKPGPNPPKWTVNWSDKIVLAKTAGSKTDTALASTDTIYVAWALANFGTAGTSVRFYSELYVDGFLRGTWYTDPPLASNFYAYVEDFSIGSLSGGTHTIRLKVDSTGVIPESDETDNEYTRTFTVSGPAGPCVASATTVCLNGGQFAVTITWQTSTASGTGTIVPLTDDTAAVWFFSPTNLEVMFKVVKGCAFNNYYWVFAGGLTNVKVTIKVVNTKTGAVQTFDNPLNTPFQAIQATAAFPCS